MNVQVHLGAHHHFGKLVLVGFRSIYGADITAFAQNGNAVGKGEYLVQLVGNDDDGLAVVTHVT